LTGKSIVSGGLQRCDNIHRITANGNFMIDKPTRVESAGKIAALTGLLRLCVWITLCWCGQLAAQTSIGRGWPVSPAAAWVGAGTPFYNVDSSTARNGAVPPGIEPLARDIFTSDDFYRDKELWRDPRYFRCNSTLALDSQWGDYSTGPRYIVDNPAMGAWGHCELDYARENLVSPYPFKSAQAHYTALLAEARSKGGPASYSRTQLPPDWDGRYTRIVDIVFGLEQEGKEPVVPPQLHEAPQWIVGFFNQIPTILSLLTPDYQQRLVQQLYHQAHDHAAQWSLMYCRPEGFMRWWSGPGGPGALDITVTPARVQFLGGSGNAIRNVHVGRSFDLSGAVPRLGADIPRWLGESIGFWDGDALITWTSNIQGWFTHSSWEFSNKLQTIEIWTPRRGSDGKLLGLDHEAVFYDDEGLAQPIRALRFLARQGDLNDVQPNNLTVCHQTIFPIDGRGTPIVPGTVIQYQVEDWYGRPWAAIWEKYFEKGMQKPEKKSRFGLP